MFPQNGRCYTGLVASCNNSIYILFSSHYLTNTWPAKFLTPQKYIIYVYINMYDHILIRGIHLSYKVQNGSYFSTRIQ